MVEPAGRTLPDHVDPRHVVHFDPVTSAEITAFPPAAFDALRRPHPVFYSPLYGGFWVMTRYEDIAEAFKDDAHFGQWSAGIPPVPYAHAQIPLGLDRPEHTPWRRLLMPFFTPGRAKLLEPVLRVVARDKVASFVERGECEIYADYAIPLAAAAFGIQMGMSADLFPALKSLAHDVAYGSAKVANERGVAEASAFRRAATDKLDAILSDIVPQRRRNPGNDLVSALIEARLEVAEGESRPLTDAEITGACELLFRAGTDSTASMISYCFLHLAANPEQRAQILAGPHEQLRAVNELMRYNSFHLVPRVVRSDVRVGEVTMKKDDLVILATGAAGRDPEEFDGAGSVDLHRARNQHLAFGAGVHRCLGAHQARVEIVVAVEEFHRLIPGYGLDVETPISYVAATSKARPNAVPLVLAHSSVAAAG
ncbi:cytochrome P450 [Pseudonocardia ailaonensis]|uniref:Cytochrome P450 n=1 Tax=Pseudonocardia ailaonensis TaxID=367279 RepID=A0ABN2N3W0_9PSEU